MMGMMQKKLIASLIRCVDLKESFWKAEFMAETQGFYTGPTCHWAMSVVASGDDCLLSDDSETHKKNLSYIPASGLEDPTAGTISGLPQWQLGPEEPWIITVRAFVTSSRGGRKPEKGQPVAPRNERGEWEQKSWTQVTFFFGDRVECSGTISAHCNLHLSEMEFCPIGQAGLELLTSSDPLALASQSSGITDTWPLKSFTYKIKSLSSAL
ncbi:hypothetical protein AAY473_034905 [Plecturocebus cupreus]